MIGRLAELEPSRRRARDRPRSRRAHSLSRGARRARARGRARRVARAVAARASATTSRSISATRCASTSRAIAPGATQARREPAVQHRDAADRREPRRASGHRALVRDGAARGRRPAVRRAVDEGVRRRVGARAAHRGTNRASIRCRERCSDRLRTSNSALVAFRRTGLPADFPRLKKVVTAAFAHRRKTLPNSLELAGLASRERAVEALVAIGREPSVRAEALAPAEFLALADALR